MRRYPASREYAPTMVANGSRRHPLHSHYRRIHRNPEEIEFETFNTPEVEISEVQVRAPSSKAAGKRGRPKMSESAKARAKAAREAQGSKPAASRSASARLSKSKKAEQILLSAVRKAIAAAGGGGSAAKVLTARAPAIKIQYVGSAKAKSAVKALVSASKKAAAVKKPRKPLSPSKLAAAQERGRRLAAANKAKKAALVSNPRGRPKMTESAKARAKAAREAQKASGASNSRKSASSRLFGPYKVSILKNPVTDFEIGGVKVVPALAGAAGAVALSQLVRNLPFVANMQAGIVKDLLPAVLTVGVGAAGLYYAEKNSKSGMLKDLSKDVVAFGMFLGLNDAVGSKIRDMVDNLKKPAAPAIATATQGGAFFNGGGWTSAPMPQLEGYHMSGGESGYPPAFALTGGEGYFVPSSLALNGYHMAGDANSAATAAAITALNGGAFREQAIGGIDMSGYQD